MSIDFIFRLIGMVLFSIIGVFWGISLGQAANLNPEPHTLSVTLYAVIFGLVGALTGLVITPLITIRPIKALRTILSKVSIQTLVASLVGLVAGLVIAALLAFPLALLPSPFGDILPFVGALVFAYLGVAVFIMRQNEIFSGLTNITGKRSGHKTQESGLLEETDRTILLDTSVIIDGRIADIARTGFLQGTLLIPRFILNELQYIADSSDGLRRQRGRRGIEILSQLQKQPSMPVKLSDIDVEGVREVDDKLVVLARQLKCPILTNDYNLNRIAELQGVAVLNVNELANSVKSILLPGEVIKVDVIQEGKESGQGVAYMDDGTMVVIENGKEYLNQVIDITVTKVLQTAAGRMIFGKPGRE